MCNYHCPFADRKACAGFLLCRALYQDDVNYNLRENAMKVICGFQQQCMKTGRMENTETAKECYKAKLEAKQPKVETVPAGEKEDAVFEDAPKKKRSAKKSN